MVLYGGEGEKISQSENRADSSNTSTAAPILSIVLPCLNEESTLAAVIESAKKALAKHGLIGEIIVADNGSVDSSKKIALELQSRVKDVPEPGYGSAIVGGVAAARGHYVIMADADDTYDLDEIDRIVAPLKEGYDMVIGTRLRGRMEEGAMPVLHQYLGTPVLTFLINLLYGTKISDCNCGLRGFSKDAFDRLGLSGSGMELASEMIVKAALLKMKITEVPVTLRVGRKYRSTHLKPWSDGWRHLCLILSLWPRRFVSS